MQEDARTGKPPLGAPAKVVPLPGARAPTPGRARRSRWVIAGLISLSAVAVIAAVWWAVSGPTTVSYSTMPVTRGDISQAVVATGTVNPELTIIVGTYVSGVIQELYCDYNTVVKKGQVCAKIDPRPYQTVVDQNKANLAVARAQLEKDKAALSYAKVTLDRNARLVQTNAVSRDTYDNAKSNFEQAQAQILFDNATIQQRQAALDAAQVNLDYTNITSPVDGTVVSRNVTMGQTVAASFQTPTLFLIASDLAKMQVDTNVSESDIGDVRPGKKATFTVDAFPKRVFQGTVNQVRQSPQTVQNVVTYDIVLGVDNSDLTLKPGMTAAARVIIDQRDDVIRVPNAALRYRPGGLAAAKVSDKAQVWVLRDEEPTAVPVVSGLEDDSFTEIVSGDVKPGDQVIAAEQGETASRTVMPRLRF
jgi:HlyD family secretion protein